MSQSDVANISADWEPGNEVNFRLGQLVLLLEQARLLNRRISSIDRLGYYDFFSANPFIVTSDEYPSRERDRVKLMQAGFLEGQLSYGQAGQRYVSRRERLRADIAVLLSWGLVDLDPRGYALTDRGESIANSLSTVYADQYREAAAIVIRRLGTLTDSRLRSTVQGWLGETWLLIDFLGDVDESAASTVSVPPGQSHA